MSVEEIKGYDEPLRYIGQFLLLVEQSIQRQYLHPPLRDKYAAKIRVFPPGLKRRGGLNLKLFVYAMAHTLLAYPVLCEHGKRGCCTTLPPFGGSTEN